MAPSELLSQNPTCNGRIDIGDTADLLAFAPKIGEAAGAGTQWTRTERWVIVGGGKRGRWSHSWPPLYPHPTVSARIEHRCRTRNTYAMSHMTYHI